MSFQGIEASEIIGSFKLNIENVVKERNTIWYVDMMRLVKNVFAATLKNGNTKEWFIEAGAIDKPYIWNKRKGKKGEV